MSQHRKRYYVAAEFGQPKPYQVIERDTNTVVSEHLTEREAELAAAFLIKRKQNAPKPVTATLVSDTANGKVYHVGRQSVVRYADGSYECSCSGSAGQLGCKHIDATKKLLDNGA